jgi:hypothetical protein
MNKRLLITDLRTLYFKHIRVSNSTADLEHFEIAALVPVPTSNTL